MLFVFFVKYLFLALKGFDLRLLIMLVMNETDKRLKNIKHVKDKQSVHINILIHFNTLKIVRYYVKLIIHFEVLM